MAELEHNSNQSLSDPLTHLLPLKPPGKKKIKPPGEFLNQLPNLDGWPGMLSLRPCREKLEQTEHRASLASRAERVQLDPR